LTAQDRQLAVIGLGYVGLPVAVAFAKKFPGTIGFDVDARRVESLVKGIDWTHEVDGRLLRESGLKVTSQLGDLNAASVFVVCVPTPIYSDHRPDLRPLQSASEMVGKCLRKGGIVVYESTVYPGLTEQFCGPILARVSGLRQGVDFKLGYSPERINPGDKEHTFECIKKVVAAEDEPTAQLLADIYGSVVHVGVHVATSIKVAEAAKVLENAQRDINIALMNELAIICDLMNIRTKDVLDAAATKWNFFKFSPGLVGGHCIGVDPYYLTSKAEELGYHPEVILAGRRINDSMGAHIARRIVRFLGSGKRPLCETRVGVLGVTFKENIPDIRNSKVPDIIAELLTFGISCIIHDPLADATMVDKQYGLKLSVLSSVRECDALVLAVPHAQYLANKRALWSMLNDGGIVIDIRSALEPKDFPAGLRYWSL
jgi:UDP-N-acetyl-D-glucosamine/UDP-N-acetyl-D-galactosamine dehydrogenase